MSKTIKPGARAIYDPAVSRVVSLRVHPDTLKTLRFLAAERDMTVCSMLRIEAEKLAGTQAK